MNALREILDDGGIKTARITSGVRTAEDQSRIMYLNIKRYGVPHQNKLYGSFGDKVIQVYSDNPGATEKDVRELMRKKIEEIGPEKVSKHCSNKLDVFDVAPSSISNRLKFERAIRKAKASGLITKFIMPPGDPAYHLEVPRPVVELDGDAFKVRRGQMTFDAEGTEGGVFHSRKPTVPSSSSGITIGRGYDLKERTETEVEEDLVAATIPRAEAKKYAKGKGKVGNGAQKHIDENKLVEITPRQQKLLFNITYADIEKDVRRICGKGDVVAEYGGTDWSNLDPKIKTILIDLRFRGTTPQPPEHFYKQMLRATT